MKFSQAIVAACAFGIAVAIPGAGAGPGVASAQVTLLGPSTVANGVSADGRVVVGDLVGHERGFVWTAAGGLYDLGLEVGMPPRSTARAASADGRWVVGGATGTPFRWNGPGTYQPLGTAPPPFAGMGATGVSGDGSVIAGWGGNSVTGPLGSFYWTQAGGFQLIPGLNGQALGVSRDGGTVVGSTFQRGFTWSPTGGARFLQAPQGAQFPDTSAAAINFDGTIVVGDSAFGPTVWRNEVPTALPVVPGFGFNPLCLSDSASVVAGLGYGAGGITHGMIWTPARGTELFTAYMAAMGVNVPDGFIAVTITGVSSDGRTFVGNGGFVGNGQGFVVTVPGPAPLAALVAGAGLFARRRRR